jgi:HAMP domain-containing protein
MTTNIPPNVARHVRSRLVIFDPGASPISAETRMQYALDRLARAGESLEAGDHDAAAMWSESALMVAFEAWLMKNRLKLATSEQSHAAMADFVGWLAQRAGAQVDVWELHELVESRGRIMDHPWDSATTREAAERAVSVAGVAVPILAAFPPLRPPGEEGRG